MNAELVELRNLVTIGELVVSSALQRKESRVLHFTTSYPLTLAPEEAQETVGFSHRFFLRVACRLAEVEYGSVHVMLSIGTHYGAGDQDGLEAAFRSLRNFEHDSIPAARCHAPLHFHQACRQQEETESRAVNPLSSQRIKKL